MDDTLKKIVECIGPKHGAKKELAEHLGIHPNVITNWLNGRNKSYRRYLNEIANYYGVSVEYLKGEETAPKKEALPDLTDEDKQDIAKRLEDTLSQLMLRQEGLMFDGEPMDDVTRELLETSLRNSMELAKRMSKAREAEKRKEK